MSLSVRARDLEAISDLIPPAVDRGGRLSIDLGGTVAEIRSPDDRWLDAVRDRFGSFVVSGGSADIRIVHTPDEDAMKARYGCLSVVRPDGRGAAIAATEGTEILDGVLRSLLPPLIAPELMVHGALIAHRRSGFLCCGVSGSGKSTIAALFPEAALCDEMVRLAGGSAPAVQSLPFWRARPGTVPLTAVFELAHGAANTRTQIGAAEAIQSLRRHVYWPVGHPERMRSAFGTLSEICGSIPVFRLTFRPDRSVWDTIVEGF